MYKYKITILQIQFHIYYAVDNTTSTVKAHMEDVQGKVTVIHCGLYFWYTIQQINIKFKQNTFYNDKNPVISLNIYCFIKKATTISTV